MIHSRFVSWSGIALGMALAVGIGLFSSLAIAGSPGTCSSAKTTEVSSSVAKSSCPVFYQKASAAHLSMSVSECPAMKGCDTSVCDTDKKSTAVKTSLITAGAWSAKGLLKHAQEIGLSQDQQAQLKEIASNSERLSELSKSLKEAEHKLASLMTSPEVSIVEVEDQIRTVERERVEYRLASFRQLHQLRTVVRPEQAEALAMITSPVQQTGSPNAIVF